jgi:glyoxylase-like metal-dependent hydrolase (beta-lactamase superfamily II)
VPGEVVHRGRGFVVERLVVGPLDTNVYLVVDTTSTTALLVDAADDAEAILAFVGDRRVAAIATTHGHWDHHQAIRAVSDELDAPFLLHREDVAIADKVPDAHLEAGSLAVGGLTATVLHTPGHTPGSVCIALPGAVLTGDTLFPGGPGATRFPYGSFPAIIASVTELLEMPDDTLVLPGHGGATTMGTERPHLPEWIERGW